MLAVAALFTSLLLAAGAEASPVIVIDESVVSVPFAKHVNFGNLRGIAQKDRARAAALLSHSRGALKRSDGSIPAEALDTVQYIAKVGVGSPAQTFNLVIDTGSSNTWVGATKKYEPTSTSKSTGNAVSVTYGSGSFSGTEFIDTVSLGTGRSIKQQSIGVANTSQGFEGVDGIIGIGPVVLTEDTVANTNTVPTVTDNLFQQKTINHNLVAVSFAPIDSDADVNGELTFGETDTSKFTGSITFVPITKTSPSSFFWGIDQSISYGSTSILSKTAGIVDTGTTLVLIATNAFQKYQSATRSTLDNNTGLLRVTSAQFNALKPLNFNIGGKTFSLTANAQIWPRKLNTEIGGVSNAIYLVTNDVGSPSGQGLDFINGQTFLERFYSVFDTANKRVGLATTKFTTATSN